MDRWAGRVAVVTGASSGIGAAICKTLAKQGMIVVGAARRIEKMKEIQKALAGAKGKFVPYQCDISKDSELEAFLGYVEKTYHRIDVMINNAANVLNSTLLNGTAAEWRNLMDLNVIALAVCGQYAVNNMQKHGIKDGHVININSTAGHKVLPFAQGHFYTATKYAVNALTVGLRQEVKDLKTSIRVTSISPGFVNTELPTKMINKDLMALFSTVEAISPEDIAAAVVNVLSAPKGVEYTEVMVSPTVDINM